MDLIDRAALLEKFNDKNVDIWQVLTDEETAKRYWVYCKVSNALDEIPTIEAVPLDKLCEWLSSHAYKKTGYYITDPGEALYAQEWENDIREWMEGQHET